MISDLQMHNLRRISERFSFCDLWRQVFLTEVKTSDMFLACSAAKDALRPTSFADCVYPSVFVPVAAGTSVAGAFVAGATGAGATGMLFIGITAALPTFGG